MSSDSPFRQREDKIFFDVWDNFAKTWVKAQFTAKCFEHDGRVYKLFRAGTLAQALGRRVDTIQQWEKSGKFPKPIFSVDDNGHRYYSEDQIRMTAFMQNHILGENPSKYRGRGLNHVGFFEAVKDNWYVVDFNAKDYVVTEEETGKNDVKFDV